MMKSGFFDAAPSRDITVAKAFLVTGGTEKVRGQKISQLIHEEQFSMIHTVKKGEEEIIVFYDRGRPDGMTFEEAKAYVGSRNLGADFHTSTFGREPRFGIIDVSSLREEPSYDESRCYTSFAEFELGSPSF